jgi:hypothetical protein
MMMDLVACVLDTMKGRRRYAADQKKNRGRDPEGSRRYVASDGLHECNSESIIESIVPQGPSHVRGNPTSLTCQINITGSSEALAPKMSAPSIGRAQEWATASAWILQIASYFCNLAY